MREAVVEVADGDEEEDGAGDEGTDDEGTVVVPETALIAWQEGGRVMLSRYLPTEGVFKGPVDVAAGGRPDVAVGPDQIHLAYEEAGAIYHAGSNDDGVTFLDPLPVSESMRIPVPGTHRSSYARGWRTPCVDPPSFRW